MRKIYLKENSLESLIKGRLLPQFLFKKVKEHNTSLGDCDAFPTSTKYPYDYSILKERYSEVCERMEELGFENLEDIDGIASELSSITSQLNSLQLNSVDEYLKEGLKLLVKLKGI